MFTLFIFCYIHIVANRQCADYKYKRITALETQAGIRQCRPKRRPAKPYL